MSRAQESAFLKESSSQEPAGDPGRRIAVCYPVLGVQKAAEAFGKSRSFSVKAYKSILQLLQDFPVQRPDVIVADFFLPRTASTQLSALLASPEGQRTQVVLVSNKTELAQHRQRAQGLPRTRLVSRDTRFIPRLTEAIAEACGAPPRLHLRGALKTHAQLLLNDLRHEVRLENVSLGGAKVCGELAAPGDARVTLRVEVDGVELNLEAVVVRRYLDRGSSDWHLGLQFTRVTPEQLQRLQTLTGEKKSRGVALVKSQGRVARRVALPSRMSVKARLKRHDAAERFYVRVIDLSESGFRIVPPPSVVLKSGELVEANLLWSGRGLKGQAEVVRRMWIDDKAGGLWQFGLRFVSMDSDARAQLSRLIVDAGKRGLRSLRLRAS